MFSKNMYLFWSYYCVFAMAFNFAAGILPTNPYWYINFAAMNIGAFPVAYFAFKYWQARDEEKRAAKTNNSFLSF